MKNLKSLFSKSILKWSTGLIALYGILILFKIPVNFQLLFNVIIGIGVFTLVLSPLIILHELGHFFVGKYLGAEPEVFSVGMGKKIFGFKWLGADFIVSLLPIGGYVRFKKVQFAGEDGRNDSTNQLIAPHKWLWIALAGPVVNFVTAFVIFSFIFYGAVSSVNILKITSDTATLKAGDILVVATENNSYAELFQTFTKSNKDQHTFVFGNETRKLRTVPLADVQTLIPQVQKLSFIDKSTRSISFSGELMEYLARTTVTSLTGLVTNPFKNYKNISSPIGITQQVKTSYDMGWIYVFIIIGALSFGLGFMNILPLAVLDGGRCIIAIYQTFVSVSLPTVFMNVVNYTSLGLVMLLMAVGFIADLVRSSL